MTPEMDAKARAALATRRINPCEGCGHPQWELVALVTAPLFNPTLFHHIAANGMTPSIPMLVLGCANCGLIRQYSAVKLGLLQPTET